MQGAPQARLVPTLGGLDRQQCGGRAAVAKSIREKERSRPVSFIDKVMPVVNGEVVGNVLRLADFPDTPGGFADYEAQQKGLVGDSAVKVVKHVCWTKSVSHVRMCADYIRMEWPESHGSYVEMVDGQLEMAVDA